MYSDGARFRCGVSCFSRFHSLSSRQASDGSQAKPDSISTSLKFGMRSNTPSITRLVRKDWHDWAWPTMSSM